MDQPMMAPRGARSSRSPSEGPLIPRLAFRGTDAHDDTGSPRQPLSPRKSRSPVATGAAAANASVEAGIQNSPRFGTPRDQSSSSPRELDSARQRQEQSVAAHVRNRRNCASSSPSGHGSDGQISARSGDRRPNPLLKNASPARQSRFEASPARSSRNEGRTGDTPKRASFASDAVSPANSTAREAEEDLAPSTPGRGSVGRRGSAESLRAPPPAPRGQRSGSSQRGRKRQHGSGPPTCGVEPPTVDNLVDRRNARQSAPQQALECMFLDSSGLNTAGEADVDAAADAAVEAPSEPPAHGLGSAPSMDHLLCANSAAPPCVNRSHGVSSPISTNGSHVATPMQSHLIQLDSVPVHDNSSEGVAYSSAAQRRSSSFSNRHAATDKLTLADNVLRSARSSTFTDFQESAPGMTMSGVMGSQAELQSVHVDDDTKSDDDSDDEGYSHSKMKPLIGKAQGLVMEMIDIIRGEAPQQQQRGYAHGRPPKLRSPAESPVPWVAPPRSSVAAHSPDGCPLEVLVDLDRDVAADAAGRQDRAAGRDGGDGRSQDGEASAPPEVFQLRKDMEAMRELLSQAQNRILNLEYQRSQGLGGTVVATPVLAGYTPTVPPPGVSVLPPANTNAPTALPQPLALHAAPTLNHAPSHATVSSRGSSLQLPTANSGTSSTAGPMVAVPGPMSPPPMLGQTASPLPTQRRQQSSQQLPVGPPLAPAQGPAAPTPPEHHHCSSHRVTSADVSGLACLAPQQRGNGAIGRVQEALQGSPFRRQQTPLAPNHQQQQQQQPQPQQSPQHQQHWQQQQHLHQQPQQFHHGYRVGSPPQAVRHGSQFTFSQPKNQAIPSSCGGSATPFQPMPGHVFRGSPRVAG